MKFFAAILFLICAPVLLESCFIWEINGPEPRFAINEFTLKTLTWTSSTGWSEALSPVKPESLELRIKPVEKIVLLNHRITTGAYADQASPRSYEACNSFKISTDSTLNTTTGTFAKNEDITEYFTTYREIKGSNIDIDGFQYTPKFSMAKTQRCSFTISIALDDGREFELHSSVVELIP